MKRRGFLLAVSLLATGGLIAAVGAPAAPNRAKVAVTDYEFVPEQVKIAKGGKVTWVFEEGKHNVTGKGWKSPTKQDGTYKHVFKNVGTFKYRCTLHQPDMDGVVRVVK